MEELRKEHEEKVLMKPVFDQGNTTRSKLPNKDFLIYEDALLKFMIKLDTISSGGFEIVRDVRKSLVARSQSLLDKIDQHRKQEGISPSS